MERRSLKERLETNEQTGERKISIRRLLPNVITILALCCGLTSIRLGLQGQFEMAVVIVVFAALLDGVDGRLARLLKVESKIGAQLDSLVDFLNFGIAPVVLVYIWAMETMGRLGWLAMLCFTVCAALRLARFNVETSNPDRPVWRDNYFTGMPSPAAGLLVFVPPILEFAGLADVKSHYLLICFYTIALAGFMVSNIPTFSGKRLALSFTRKQAMPILLFVGVLGGTLLTFPWIGLLMIGATYLASIPFTILLYYRQLARTSL